MKKLLCMVLAFLLHTAIMLGTISVLYGIIALCFGLPFSFRIVAGIWAVMTLLKCGFGSRSFKLKFTMDE